MVNFEMTPIITRDDPSYLWRQQVADFRNFLHGTLDCARTLLETSGIEARVRRVFEKLAISASYRLQKIFIVFEVIDQKTLAVEEVDARVALREIERMCALLQFLQLVFRQIIIQETHIVPINYAWNRPQNETKAVLVECAPNPSKFVLYFHSPDSFQGFALCTLAMNDQLSGVPSLMC